LLLRHLAVEFPGPPVGLPFWPSCRPPKILQLLAAELAAELAADSSYRLLEVLQLLPRHLQRHQILQLHQVPLQVLRIHRALSQVFH
jgi:hypothetical protein